MTIIDSSPTAATVPDVADPRLEAAAGSRIASTTGGRGRGPLAIAALAAIAPIAWGTTGLITSELLPAGRPLTVTVIRCAPAGLLLLAARRRRWRPAMGWWRVLVLGIINFGLVFPFVFAAGYRLPGGVLSALGGTQPLIIAAISSALLGVHPSRRTLATGVAACIGVGMVVLTPAARFDPLGLVAGFGAVGSFSVGLVLTRKWAGRDDLVAITALQLLVGAAVIAPFALVVEGAPPALTTGNVAGLAFLALIGTALANVVWNLGIRRLPTSVPAVLTLLNPLTATTLGWLVLGQSFNTLQLLGLLITVGAIVAGRPRPVSPV